MWAEESLIGSDEGLWNIWYKASEGIEVSPMRHTWTYTGLGLLEGVYGTKVW